MSNKKEKHVCEHCEKDFDELVTRQGFVHSFFVEWVCKSCFLELEECSFDSYGEVKELINE